MGGQPDANPRPPTGPPKIGMSALPKEVLGHIFGFLGLRDLMSVRCVSGAHCAVANAVALRRGYHATHHLSDEAGLELRAWEREDWAWLTWRGKWGSWLETLLAEDKDDKDIIKALLQTQELSMWLEGWLVALIRGKKEIVFWIIDHAPSEARRGGRILSASTISEVGRILYSADYGIRWLLYATYAVITHSRGNPSKEPGTAVLSAVLGAYETTDARAEALSIHSHWMLRHACGNGWDEHVRLLLTSGYGTEVAAFRALTKSRAARSPSHSLLAHVLSQGHAGVLRAILDHGYASPASRATVPLVAVSSMLAAAAAAGHAGALEVFLERWWSSEEERALALAACDHEALLGAIRSRQPECVALLLRLSAAGGPGSAPQLSNMRDGAHELRCLARECEGCGCGSCPACATLSRLRQAAPLQVERLLEEVPSEGVTAATGAAGQAAAREEEAEERGHAADGATSRAAGRWACRAAVDGELVLELTEALDADGVAIPVVPECSPPVDTSSAFAGF